MIRTNALPGKGRVTGVASARVGAVCVYAHAVLANVLQAFVDVCEKVHTYINERVASVILQEWLEWGKGDRRASGQGHFPQIYARGEARQ